MRLQYAVQPKPEGLAQAFLIGEDFVRGHDTALILGDNIFYGNDLSDLMDAANRKTQGGDGFCLPSERSGTLRRGRIRSRWQGYFPRRKTRRTEIGFCRDRAVFL